MLIKPEPLFNTHIHTVEHGEKPRIVHMKTSQRDLKLISKIGMVARHRAPKLDSFLWWIPENEVRTIVKNANCVYQKNQERNRTTSDAKIKNHENWILTTRNSLATCRSLFDASMQTHKMWNERKKTTYSVVSKFFSFAFVPKWKRPNTQLRQKKSSNNSLWPSSRAILIWFSNGSVCIENYTAINDDYMRREVDWSPKKL